MTDGQLDEIVRRAKAGDREAQARIDAWIEETLGAISATPPVDCKAELADREALTATAGCAP